MDINDLRNVAGSKGIAGWVRWAVREKKIVYVLVLGLVAVGVLGLFKMNKDEFPTFEIKQGLVVGIYPGANAEEVEQQLTKPLEETLFSFREVDRKSTHSVTRNGMCYIYVDLNVHQSKKDEVWSKLKLGLQARKMTLPAGVLAVGVLDDFSNTSSMLIAVESDDKSYSELQEYTDILCEKLRQIPDLAKVNVVGKQQEEIAVTLDREKISSYGIDASTIMLSYRSSALAVPAGTFDTRYTYAPIHVAGTIGSEREVAEHIIYADPLGNIVRLKDIAKVERRYRSPSEFVSYNGNSCLVLNVEMRPGNDIVAFGREVDAVLQKFSAQLPDSVSMSRISDMSEVVGNSVWSFLRDLVISMLVVILVMLMLFPMRSALIASSGVPVCTAIAVAIMYMTGMDLNTVTLAALIVVLGMIVDDSIITMDGYMDKTSRGLKGTDAAATAAGELFTPTLVATLAICLMFFPIKMIITGYLGDFVDLFPWVILIALMTSLFYAVTVVPSLEVRFIRPEDPEKPKSSAAKAQDSFFRAIQKFYDWCQDWCFRHPKLTIASGIGIVGTGVLIFLNLNIQMMPKAARDYFVVEMYLESGNGVGRTKELADSLTSILNSDSRVKSVTAFVGTGAPRFCATYTPILPSPQTAQLVVNTKSPKATEEILREYELKYEHIFPEAMLHFKQMDYQLVDAPIMVEIKSEDRERLSEVAARIKSYMLSMQQDLKWVHSSSDDFEPSVNVRLDPDEAARLGVNKAILSLSLAGTFNGQTIADFWENGNDVPVNIYSEGVGPDMPYETISNQMVATSIPGVSVPLRQVADVEPGCSLAQLCRDDGMQTVCVYADLKMGKSQPAAEKKIRKYVKSEILPTLDDDMSLSFEGLSGVNKAVIPEILLSFIAACTVLFLFLLVHFKKTSIAVLTMVLSSLCLFGASLGLWIFNLDFGLTAVLGLISLVGIIVRNGILMFEYAEEARFEHGEDVMTASMDAGKRRMRPIFLTSCTTALGVLPMIISGDLLWMPMGVVICFGTMLSILPITLIMPVSYWRIFKNADKMKNNQ